MTSAAQRVRDRHVDVLRRRIATERARHALTMALYEALADGLEFGPRDLASPADREWVHGAMAVPLQESADVALDALVWRIAILLERAPDELGARYVRSHDASELGLE
jgi:hypothetical protein